jgi:hypothetical protein
MAIEIAEFHPFIYPIIPQIIDLIKDNDSNSEVRQACVSLLVRFSEQGKTPKLSSFTLLTTTIAEFRHSIGPAVPIVGDLLKETNRIIRETGTVALWEVSRQGNCWLFRSGIANEKR